MVFVAVVAVLAGACGSSSRGEDVSAPTPSDTEASSPAGSAGFGTLASPCGEGDASGATDQGVTDESIQIAYGDDAGYQGSPGLDHEVSDAVEAFIGWCNDQGGINGREVVGTYYDAAVTEVTNRMTEACQSAFYFVGELYVADDLQEPIRRECGLPAVPAAAGTATFANAPLKHEAVPSAIDRSSVYAGVELAEMFPDSVQHVGVLWGNYPVMIDRRDNVQYALSERGWVFDPDCSLPYNIAGEADYKPFVQKLKDCGAEVVYWIGAPAPQFENVLDAAHQLDFEPIWYADTNAYDANFAAWNKDGFADNVYFRMGFLPLEETDASPAVQQYLDIVQGNGGDVSLLGAQAATSFLLWATAVQACGSELTRACVEAELDGIHEWDGGGLHAPADPGDNEPPTCGLMMKLEGTEFVRVAPEEPGTFECDPSYVVDIPPGTDVLVRNNIGADRIAQL